MKFCRIILVLTLTALLILTPSACSIFNKSPRVKTSEVNGTLAGVDALGRTLALPGEAPEPREGRYIGLFYFLWLGQHGTDGPYDITRIKEEHPEALKDPNSPYWGPKGAFHHWGKPMFGYYTSDDGWVFRKHVQMLTDAGVDFLVFDTTNAFTYDLPCDMLLQILDEYRQKGWNVPKIAFYTNSSSGDTIQRIYENIYKPGRYKELWFMWDGKPLIIGKPEECSKEVRDFFRIKKSQWPNEPQKLDGFPWMDWNRPQRMYLDNERNREIMNVSVAQHVHGWFSLSAFYEPDKNWNRSYHDGKVDNSEGAVNYGYNFAEQFEYAIKQDPEIIFITGWNEWQAQRFDSGRPSAPVMFVDCADQQNSRDVEPMEGGHGDNYYMQMINYIRLFKGTAGPVDPGSKKTIKIDKGFEQWDNVKAVYTDYTNDTAKRAAMGYGNEMLTNTTGRNDIELMKVARDKKYIYFYVQTVENMTPKTDKYWMNLFISTGNKDNKTWEGYDFVVNRKSPTDSEAILEKSKGGWNWEEVGKVQYRVEGNKMHIAIPRKLLGLEDTGKPISIQFKWADNYQSEGDIFDFYKNGDAAPLGRLNYVFTESIPSVASAKK